VAIGDSCVDFDMCNAWRAHAAAVTVIASARARKEWTLVILGMPVNPSLILCGKKKPKKREEAGRERAFSSLSADATLGGAI